MRRVFLIGLGIGVTVLWLYKMGPGYMTEDIIVWMLTPNQKDPLPTEQILFLCLTGILPMLSTLYTFIAPTLKIVNRKVNNHFDMLLCGMFTGILLRWFADLGQTEVATGVALFLLGFYVHVYYSHIKPGLGRLLLLVATLAAVIWLDGEMLYDNDGLVVATGGLTLVMLGTFTEYNLIRAIRAFTIQSIPWHILSGIGLLLSLIGALFYRKPKAESEPADEDEKTANPEEPDTPSAP